MMKIIDADEHAVSIHIRRGDYLLPKFWANAGCVCQLPYYKNAITELEKHETSSGKKLASGEAASHLSVPALAHVDPTLIALEIQPGVPIESV